MDSPAEIARDLSAKQRRWMLDAYPLSGPSVTLLILDDEDDPFDPDLVDPITGRILPLGLAVRAELQKGKSDE